jgi:hypothetical protein
MNNDHVVAARRRNRDNVRAIPLAALLRAICLAHPAREIDGPHPPGAPEVPTQTE